MSDQRSLGAIETRYNGYRFRSRLEARWAVFFDALGTPWEFEVQGYETPFGRYLPDFLVAGRLLVEVKPPRYRPGADELGRWMSVAMQTSFAHAVVRGVPGDRHPVIVDGRDVRGCEPLQVDPNGTSPWPCRWGRCRRCGSLAYGSVEPQFAFFRTLCDCPGTASWEMGGSSLLTAFGAAKGARFEFGETPVFAESPGRKSALLGAGEPR